MSCHGDRNEVWVSGVCILHSLGREVTARDQSGETGQFDDNPSTRVKPARLSIPLTVKRIDPRFLYAFASVRSW